ncbi:MAG: NAD(P)-dependent alcohol dehydrogenase [Paracoccaceae bacterium]
MKVATCRHYGAATGVRIEMLPDPAPGAGEVLIKVFASTVTSGDWRVRSQTVPWGFGLLMRAALGWNALRQPILGTEFCGEVVALGAGVRGFAPGDCVVGFTGAAMGCHAELVVMAAAGVLVHKPLALSIPEAAAISFGGTAALTFLRDGGRVQVGEQVLVIGAAGNVGIAAVQIAKAMGAEVTAQCGAAHRGAMKALGAARVIDRDAGDFTQGGQVWDVIFDATGSVSYAQARPVLSCDGRLLLLAADLPQMMAALGNPFRRQKVRVGPAAERLEDLRVLAEMAEAGAYRPIIDSRFPLEQIAKAHQRVEQHGKCGSVVVMMDARG